MNLFQFFGVTKKHKGVPGPLDIIFTFLLRFGHEDSEKFTIKALPIRLKQDGWNVIILHVYLHRLSMTCKFFRQFIRNWRREKIPAVVEMEKSLTIRCNQSLRKANKRNTRKEKRQTAKNSLLHHLLEQFQAGTLESARSLMHEISAARTDYSEYELTHRFEIGRVRYDRLFSSCGFENFRILNEQYEVLIDIPLQNAVKHYTAHQIIRVHNEFIFPKSDRFYGKLERRVENLLGIDYLRGKYTNVNHKIRYENISGEVIYTLHL